MYIFTVAFNPQAPEHQLAAAQKIWKESQAYASDGLQKTYTSKTDPTRKLNQLQADMIIVSYGFLNRTQTGKPRRNVTHKTSGENKSADFNELLAKFDVRNGDRHS